MTVKDFFNNLANMPKKRGSVSPVFSMKAFWGSRGIAPSFLNFELVGDVWSASCSGKYAQKNSSWCPLNVRLDTCLGNVQRLDP
jgi:hypothetical protein